MHNEAQKDGTKKMQKTGLPDPLDRGKDPTIISSSIQITGELSGGENLVVKGRVNGTVRLKDNHVTIGSSGRIKGDVYGKLISVEGAVEGNLFGEEKIELQQSAVVTGDLKAPRINLQEGAKFNGQVEMEIGSQEPAGS